MTRVEWTRGARRDLETVHTYIAKDSTFQGIALSNFLLSVDRLRSFPQSGRRISETIDETIREVIFQDYRIIYRFENDIVRVMTVIHGARDFSEKKLRSWQE